MNEPTSDTQTRPGPLAGMRVVDFSQAASGPFCTQHLGDMGADIIKIEPPQGDMIRGWDDEKLAGLGTYFIGLNRNKRSVVLDLKTEHGQDVAMKLARKADIVVENYRPGVMDKLGFGYEDVSVLNPSVIYVSISAFGEEGPLRDRAGMDIVLQAFGGIMGITGEEGGAPVKVGSPVADLGTGYAAAMGTLAAVVARERYHVGQHVKISMLNVVVSMLSNHTSGYLMYGRSVQRMGSGHPQLVPYQAFRTKDERFLIVGILNERFWVSFCHAIDREDLTNAPEFITNTDRVRNRARLIELLTNVMEQRPAQAWEEIFEANDVPYTRVNTFEDLFSHPQVQSAKTVVDIPHKKLGSVRVIAQPVELSCTPAGYRRPPPELGEHTAEVLRELGLENISS